MGFNSSLVQRVRTILQEKYSSDVIQEQDTGNEILFLLNGKTVCGVREDFLVVNVGQDRLDEILTHPLARPHAQAGCVEIVPTGTARDVDLAGWIRTGVEFARSTSAQA